MVVAIGLAGSGVPAQAATGTLPDGTGFLAQESTDNDTGSAETAIEAADASPESTEPAPTEQPDGDAVTATAEPSFQATETLETAPGEVNETPSASEEASAAGDEVVPASQPTFVFPDLNTRGTVNVARFACSGIASASISVGSIAAAGLPSGPGSCTPAGGVVTFSFQGGLPNSSQMAVQHTGSMDLPAGTYSVTDEASGTQTTVTFGDGEVVNLSIFVPAVGAPPTVTAGTGTVSMAVFQCTNVNGTVFSVDSVSAAAQVDCTIGTATITFYLVGDGTADYAQVVVDGSGAISLNAGVYEIVIEETQAHTFITVPAGGVVSLTVTRPMMSGAGQMVEGASASPGLPSAASGQGSGGTSGAPTSVLHDLAGSSGRLAEISSAGFAARDGVNSGGSSVRSGQPGASASNPAIQERGITVTAFPKAGAGQERGMVPWEAGAFLLASCLLVAGSTVLRRRGR
jgi:hypothetical protein